MLPDDIEEWRPVTRAPDYYEVSNLGRVRRALHAPPRSGTRPGKVLKPGLAGAGYPFVNLSIGNVHREHYVHRLVAEAFLGAPPAESYEVDHLDGVRTNNHVSNLEWVTASRNQQRAWDNGLIPLGLRQALTEDDVRFIRSPEGRALSADAVAARFGIHRNYVHSLRRGINWRHIV